MKIASISILALLFYSCTSFAQMKKGDNLLGPVVGFNADNSAITIGAHYEYEILNANFGLIGVGGSFKYYEGGGVKNSLIGVQSNINLTKISGGKAVPFVGGTMAINTSLEGLRIWLQGGVRYFFVPSVAAVVRLQLGNFHLAIVEGGLDFKF